MALSPELTDLDKRVLGNVVEHPKRRVSSIAHRARLSIPDTWNTLRGLEHLGLVQSNKGWWWK
jgi:DNA-binding Lrp family transcriptional regulator